MSLLDGDRSHDDGTSSTDAFKKLFRVGVQNSFLRTPEMIKIMGTPTTGDKRLDKQIQARFVEILASPIACVEYYEMGAAIRFRNSETAAAILNILLMHLKNWNYISTTMYNVLLPPQEELEAIASFCDVMVKFAGANAGRRQTNFTLRKEMLLSKSSIRTDLATGNNKDRRVKLSIDTNYKPGAKDSSGDSKAMNLRDAFKRSREENS